MQPLARTLSRQTMPQDILQHPPAGIDWNWQFAHLNETFDDLAKMAPAPAHSPGGERLAAWEHLWESAGYDIGVLGGRNIGTVGNIPRSLKRLLAKNLPVNVRYHNMLLLARNPLLGVDYFDQVHRSLILVKIAYALELYREAQGNYPELLAALSPAYFKRLPVDPKTGKFAFYARRGNGYELTFRKWVLHSRWAPFVPGVGSGGPKSIIMPPPAPTGWQKGPFP